MKFSENIFRAYDIRGIVNVDLTPEVMLNLGMAFGTCLKRGNVVVGMDARNSGSLFSYALFSGLVSTGVSCTDIGVTPIGVTSYGIEKLKSVGGAYIGASHNPPEFNGLKLLTKGGNYSHRLDKKVRNVFKSGKFLRVKWDKVGNVERVDIIDDYVKFVVSKVKPEKRLKVGVECLHGTTGVVAPKVFSALGFKVFPLHHTPNGKFPLGAPDPKPEKLIMLKRLVRKKKLDFGVAYDGDGDRLIIIDDKGNLISPERIASFLMKTVGKRKSSIVVNVECSSVVDDVAKELGIKVKRVRVGHFFILEAIKKYKAFLGVERSGHVSLPSLREFDDAVLVSAKIGELISKLSVPLSEFMKEIPDYPLERVSVKCPDTKKFGVVERIKKRFEGKRNVVTIDGVRINFDYGWVLIRPSNTEPLIRVTAEAKDRKKLKELVSYGISLVRKEMKR